VDSGELIPGQSDGNLRPCHTSIKPVPDGSASLGRSPAKRGRAWKFMAGATQYCSLTPGAYRRQSGSSGWQNRAARMSNTPPATG
jgi:hypothetical protein